MFNHGESQCRQIKDPLGGNNRLQPVETLGRRRRHMGLILRTRDIRIREHGDEIAAREMQEHAGVLHDHVRLEEHLVAFAVRLEDIALPVWEVVDPPGDGVVYGVDLRRAHVGVGFREGEHVDEDADGLDAI